MLSDDEKERAVQSASLGLLGSCYSIFWRSGVCVIASLLPVYLLAGLGLTTSQAVFEFLSRWDVLVCSSLAICCVMYWMAKRRASAPDSDYSTMDRAVHKLAFANSFVQLTGADLEDSLYAAELKNIGDQPPIFITSLPRAGTTVLLNALHDVPGVATHLYRDMPFVMAPLLWSRLSGMFAHEAPMKERAHGDGIEVGYDSPEALEEVLWRAFWPAKYHDDQIDLWGVTDKNSEAEQIFRRHFRKIIALRCSAGGRYVSKNNGNIARLDLIPAMFPGAQIIVPLREPLEQVASLLRQHRNFL